MITGRLLGLALALCLTLGAQAQTAQKLGHVNSAEILDMMPQVESADKQLSAFQEGLIKGGESKVKTFEANLKKYQDDVKAGTLSKVQQAERESALNTERDAISEYEAQVQFQVMQKREELLKPILEQLDTVIQTVGKEGGYTFIFDTSVAGAVLFAQESDDLTDVVKQKLGLK